MSFHDAMNEVARAGIAPPTPMTYEGRFAADVASPRDLATVVSDAFGGGLLEQGTAPWPYRGEGVLPRRGDPVWFTEEDGGGIVIVNWQSTLSPTQYPRELPPIGDAGGDLSGTYPDPTVETVLNGQIPVVEDDARLADPRVPRGAAGGDLSGSYPNPSLRSLPKARVFNSASLNMRSSVDITLTFDRERYDASNMHSTSVNPSRLTCVEDGVYRIGGNVGFASNASGARFLSIVLNGTTLLNQNVSNAVSGARTWVQVGTEYELRVGDYVELRANQSSGGDLTIDVVNNTSPEFFISKVP